MHAVDRQTDGRTEFSSLDCICIPCSTVKTKLLLHQVPVFFSVGGHWLIWLSLWCLQQIVRLRQLLFAGGLWLYFHHRPWKKVTSNSYPSFHPFFFIWPQSDLHLQTKKWRSLKMEMVWGDVNPRVGAWGKAPSAKWFWCLYRANLNARVHLNLDLLLLVLNRSSVKFNLCMEKMRVKQRPLNPNGKTVFLQSAVRSVFCNICHSIYSPHAGPVSWKIVFIHFLAWWCTRLTARF